MWLKLSRQNIILKVYQEESIGNLRAESDMRKQTP